MVALYVLQGKGVEGIAQFEDVVDKATGEHQVYSYQEPGDALAELHLTWGIELKK